jgi:murein DD-endopeptidase MepM/ murein hydrolase activator NlpD
MHYLSKATIIVALYTALVFVTSPCTQAEAEIGHATKGKSFSKIAPAILMLLPESLLTHLPCDSDTLIWIQPYGNVDHGGGNAFFHDGIDFGNPNGPFFSSSEGVVKEVDLDTGKGWPGSNYRITIQVTPRLILDYHFEIGGIASEYDRKANIFVASGDRVIPGQRIANLISIDQNVAHVHWGVYERGSADECPLDYFAVDAAKSLEALYDSGIEKRPRNRFDLCE